MKKSILAIAVMALVTMSASGAAFKWSSDKIYFDTALLKENTSLNAYLLYLDNGTLSSYTVDTSFSPATVGTEVQSINSSSRVGRTGGSFSFTYGGDYGNGDVFALLLSYVDNGVTYWNLSSGTQTIDGVTDDDKDFTGTAYQFSSTVNEANTPLTAGGGWVPAVPEPATGALALAGLALLFRRRRA